MATVGHTDSVGVVLEGRHFGMDQPMDVKFRQPIPEALTAVGVDLRTRSALLGLGAQGHPLTRPLIADAYGADLRTLERRREEFTAWMREVIRCSIVSPAGRAPLVEADVQKAWAELRAEVPAVGSSDLLRLPFERARRLPSELIGELQGEYRDATHRLIQLFTFWLHRLVEGEFIGLVEWAGEAADVCRYHFIQHEYRQDVLGEEIRAERAGPIWGGTVTTFLDRAIRSQLFGLRYVHHLVGATLHRPEEYPHLMPERIHRLLKTAPLWLRPHVLLVDGQLTRQEIVRQQIADRTAVETRVLSVYRYDPGVLLGPFIIAGWTAEEVEARKRRR
jgi:hypothetical protein